MTYTYQYPHPALTADTALFTSLSGRLSILLIRRAHAPFEGCWALPGGFLDMDETLAACARRELREETGVDAIGLSPVGAFDRPDRDPRERVITQVFAGAIWADDVTVEARSDASDGRWFALDALPGLAFDHAEIIAQARLWLRRHDDPLALALRMLPPDFAPADLAKLYREIAG